jgi:hypothetical protein
MNSQNDNESSGQHVKAALIGGIFVLLAAVIGGFFLILNTMVDNGAISLGANNPIKAQATSTQSSSNVTDAGERYFETEGGFSYIAPSGWRIMEYPGLKYKISIGTPVDNFAPNFNVVDENFISSLESYVTANLETLKTILADLKVISQEDFKTDDGKNAIKVTVEDTQSERHLRQVFYFFAAGDTKFVITYTRLSTTSNESDILVDESMKTFRVEK